MSQRIEAMLFVLCVFGVFGVGVAVGMGWITAARAPSVTVGPCSCVAAPVGYEVSCNYFPQFRDGGSR